MLQNNNFQLNSFVNLCRTDFVEQEFREKTIKFILKDFVYIYSKEGFLSLPYLLRFGQKTNRFTEVCQSWLSRSLMINNHILKSFESFNLQEKFNALALYDYIYVVDKELVDLTIAEIK